MPTITYITQIERESADGTTAVLKDYTTYTTPARSDLALFLKLVKRSAELVDTDIEIDKSLPVTVTEWTFDLAGGGWYYATIFEFPVWEAGTYDTDACVYYTVNGRFYRAMSDAVTALPSDNAYWEDITDDPTAILETDTNME